MTSRKRMSVSSTLSSGLRRIRIPGQAPRKGGVEATAAYEASRTRLISPLMRRIMLVNVLPLVLLAITMLFLNQFRNSLLATEVTGLREQARIYAGALGQIA
ncbi:sensor N-terminal transmembrane domain-containing protein, partial [Acetobacter cerevisiae]